MVKAILFDCFGVLTEDAWVAFCSELDPSIVHRAHELSHKRNSGFLSDEEFVKQVSEITGKPRETVRATQATLNGSITKNIPLLDYIRELKQQDYRIGIMSNIGSDWITSELLTPREQQMFDHMILSYEVGVTKPDPRIYQVATERFNLPAEQIVFIDDQGSYVEAAKAQGMHGIVYTNLGTLKTELNMLLDSNQ